jgi:hypothetical protein
MVGGSALGVHMDLIIANGGAHASKLKETVRQLIFGVENKTLVRQDKTNVEELLFLNTQFDIRLHTGKIGRVGRNKFKIQLMLISFFSLTT